MASVREMVLTGIVVYVDISGGGQSVEGRMVFGEYRCESCIRRITGMVASLLLD